MKKLMLLLTLMGCGSSESSVWGNCDQKLPKILIIGDSISQGYTPFVATALAGKACVTHTVTNNRYSFLTATHIWDYLDAYRPDYVVWNNGLWDMDIDPAGNYVYVTGLDQYQANLRITGNSLGAASTPALFLTSTPTPPTVGGRRPEDVPIFNDAAKEVMAELEIPVYDLNTWASDRLDLQQPNNVHWTAEGYEYLAQFVTNAILSEVQFKRLQK